MVDLVVRVAEAQGLRLQRGGEIRLVLTLRAKDDPEGGEFGAKVTPWLAVPLEGGAPQWRAREAVFTVPDDRCFQPDFVDSAHLHIALMQRGCEKPPETPDMAAAGGRGGGGWTGLTARSWGAASKASASMSFAAAGVSMLSAIGGKAGMAGGADRGELVGILQLPLGKVLVRGSGDIGSALIEVAKELQGSSVSEDGNAVWLCLHEETSEGSQATGRAPAGKVKGSLLLDIATLRRQQVEEVSVGQFAPDSITGSAAIGAHGDAGATTPREAGPPLESLERAESVRSASPTSREVAPGVSGIAAAVASAEREEEESVDGSVSAADGIVVSRGSPPRSSSPPPPPPPPPPPARSQQPGPDVEATKADEPLLSTQDMLQLLSRPPPERSSEDMQAWGFAPAAEHRLWWDGGSSGPHEGAAPSSRPDHSAEAGSGGFSIAQSAALSSIFSANQHASSGRGGWRSSRAAAAEAEAGGAGGAADGGEGGKPAPHESWSELTPRVRGWLSSLRDEAAPHVGPLKARLRFALDPGLRQQRREIQDWRRWHEVICILNELEQRLSDTVALLLQAVASMRRFKEKHALGEQLPSRPGGAPPPPAPIRMSALLQDAALYLESEWALPDRLEGALAELEAVGDDFRRISMDALFDQGLPHDAEAPAVADDGGSGSESGESSKAVAGQQAGMQVQREMLRSECDELQLNVAVLLESALMTGQQALAEYKKMHFRLELLAKECWPQLRLALEASGPGLFSPLISDQGGIDTTGLPPQAEQWALDFSRLVLEASTRLEALVRELEHRSSRKVRSCAGELRGVLLHRVAVFPLVLSS